MNQNEVLNVCVYPTASDVIIKEVRRFSIDQGDMAVTFITPDSRNALTTVADEGTAKVSISTVLISAFFIDPATITAKCLVVLSFADTGSRQLTHIGSKDGDSLLQVGNDEAGQGVFDVSLELATEDSDADGLDEIDPSSAIVNVYNSALVTLAMAASVLSLM